MRLKELLFEPNLAVLQCDRPVGRSDNQDWSARSAVGLVRPQGGRRRDRRWPRPGQRPGGKCGLGHRGSAEPATVQSWLSQTGGLVVVTVKAQSQPRLRPFTAPRRVRTTWSYPIHLCG